MKNNEIENKIKNYKITSKANLCSELLAKAKEQQTNTRCSGVVTKGYFMSHKLKFVSAAAIIIIAGLMFTTTNVFVGTTYAFEQTLEALAKIKTVYIEMVDQRGQETIFWAQYNKDSGKNKVRAEFENGDIAITVPGQGYLYDFDKNTVILKEEPTVKIGIDFTNTINSLVDIASKNDADITIERVFDEDFNQKVISATLKTAENTVVVIIDPKTNLPLAARQPKMPDSYYEENHGSELSYTEVIEFDVEIPEDAFEFEMPDRAQINDNRSEELKQQLANQDYYSIDYVVEETTKALKEIYNAHMIVVGVDQSEYETWRKINSETGENEVMKLYWPKSKTTIVSATEKTYKYQAKQNLVTVFSYKKVTSSLDFTNIMGFLAEKFPKVTVDKKFDSAFDKEVLVVNAENSSYILVILIDPETMLPVKISCPWTSNKSDNLHYTKLIEFNVDLPDNFFEFEIPENAKVVEAGYKKPKYFDNPKYGMAHEQGMSDQQAYEKIIKVFFDSIITSDFNTTMMLYPELAEKGISHAQLEDAIKSDDGLGPDYKKTQLIKIGKAYNSDHCIMGLVLPCKFNVFEDGSYKEDVTGIIIVPREIDGVKSCIVGGFFNNDELDEIDFD